MAAVAARRVADHRTMNWLSVIRSPARSILDSGCGGPVVAQTYWRVRRGPSHYSSARRRLLTKTCSAIMSSLRRARGISKDTSSSVVTILAELTVETICDRCGVAAMRSTSTFSCACRPGARIHDLAERKSCLMRAHVAASADSAASACSKRPILGDRRGVRHIIVTEHRLEERSGSAAQLPSEVRGRDASGWRPRRALTSAPFRRVSTRRIALRDLLDDPKHPLQRRRADERSNRSCRSACGAGNEIVAQEPHLERLLDRHFHLFALERLCSIECADLHRPRRQYAPIRTRHECAVEGCQRICGAQHVENGAAAHLQVARHERKALVQALDRLLHSALLTSWGGGSALARPRRRARDRRR